MHGTEGIDGLDFDEPTAHLERLVEETHVALVRKGLLPPDTGRGGTPVDVQSATVLQAAPGESEYGRIPSLDAVQPAATAAQAASDECIPSLDAVDRALDELQMGLAEIDRTLGRPAGACVQARRPVTFSALKLCECGATFETDSAICHRCSAKRPASAHPEVLAEPCCTVQE
jgi:hypothetical protein